MGDYIITNVVLGSDHRFSNIIKFTATEDLRIGDYFTVYFKEKQYNFQVCGTSASINCEKLNVVAKDIGYYNRIEYLDIREFVGSKVEIVTDVNKIKQMMKESCYC